MKQIADNINQRAKGQTAIISIVLVMSVVLALTASLVSFEIREHSAVRSAKDVHDAYYTAEGEMENVLRMFSVLFPTIPASVTTINRHGVQINRQVTGTDPDYTIVVTARKGSVYRTLQATYNIDSTAVVVTEPDPVIPEGW